MLSIDYDFGFLGGLAITITITVGIIVAVFVFAAAKTARDSVVEEEQDRRFHQGKDEDGGPIA